MKNGRENRNNGNQEKGKEEKETLSTLYEVKRGRAMRPLSFLGSTPNEAIAAGILRYAHHDVVDGPQNPHSFSVGPANYSLHAMRNAFLAFRTQAAICTEVAVVPGIRLERSICNSLRGGFHAFARGEQI